MTDLERLEEAEAKAVDCEVTVIERNHALIKLEREVVNLRAQLAECYRLTGADPDGAEDIHLAQNAVHAVKELREEADKAGDWEERAFVAEKRVAVLEERIETEITHLKDRGERNKSMAPLNHAKRLQEILIAGK